MRFMVFVKSNAQSEAGVLPDEKMLSAMGRYNEELIRAGTMLAGEGLKPSSKGARVRLAQGKMRNIDGPFAGAKELVGGYWLLQFPSYEEAVSTLKRAPLPHGEFEIRPLYETGDFAVDAREQPGGWRDQEVAASSEAAQSVLPPRIPGTTRYISFLKADKHTESGAEPAPELLAEMGALIEEMTKAGVMLSGDGLKPSREGKRIVFDGAKRTVIDGPFAETKELIAGVCMMQTRTLAEALEWSRRMLEIHTRGVGVSEGECEVRALHELTDFPVDPKEKPDGWRAHEQAFRERTGL
jgi:hypothetical protein